MAFTQENPARLNELKRSEAKHRGWSEILNEGWICILLAWLVGKVGGLGVFLEFGEKGKN